MVKKTKLLKIKFFIFASSDVFIKKPGGATKSLLLLTSGLKGKGYDVSIICFGNENKEAKITFNRVEIGIIQYKINRLADFLITPFLYYLYKIVKKESGNADSLHFYNVQLDPVAGLYKIFNKEKVVISTLNNYMYVSPNFECSLNGKPVYRYNFLQRILGFKEFFINYYGAGKTFLLLPFIPLLSLLYSINLFLSRRVKSYTALGQGVKEIYELNGFKNIKVIPNMYDDSFTSEKNIKKENIVLFVGRIKKSKGLGNLINAFINSSLVSRGYVLRIVGSGGKLFDDLKEQFESPNIIFVGSLPYAEVQKEYLKAEVFVHPGLWPEPFGRTILEAIQNGCKMLVSNVGEPPNIVQKKECIYQYDDIQELREKLEDMTLKKELGFVNKEILKKYSPEKIVLMYEEVYGELLG